MKIVAVFALSTIILISAAYYLGYRSERVRFAGCKNELQATRQQLGSVESQLRIWRLEGRLLNLIETAELKNFGEARNASTAFFDEVRAEIGRTDQGEFKSTLASILNSRDTVTVGLTTADPETARTLRQFSIQLRQLVER